jgi:RNA polymerase sigma-70 factor (ECF subfamily)
MDAAPETHAALPSAADLVRAAANGEREAETLLCERFGVAIRTFARRRLRGSDAVEEFAQDVLLQLIQALRTQAVEDPTRIGGFVLGICRNLARDRVRSHERRAALWSQFGVVLAALEDEQEESRRHEVAQLEDCLSQLAQRTRDVIRYAYVDGHSAPEIAVRMTMTEGNVRVLRHRALHTLRDCMSQRIFWEASS